MSGMEWYRARVGAAIKRAELIYVDPEWVPATNCDSTQAAEVSHRLALEFRFAIAYQMSGARMTLCFRSNRKNPEASDAAKIARGFGSNVTHFNDIGVGYCSLYYWVNLVEKSTVLKPPELLVARLEELKKKPLKW